MSESGQVDRLSGSLGAACWALALAVGIGSALEVSAEHLRISGTGGLAITLLLCSLTCSPAATILSSRGAASTAVALRRARRGLGLSAAFCALTHASLGAYGYLAGIDLGPIFAVPWLRHGALALLVLGALSLTSFPVVARTLRVRAWSALHRWVYVAALLAGLHTTGAPFADVEAGVFALGLVFALLLVRPIAAAIAWRQRRARASEP